MLTLRKVATCCHIIAGYAKFSWNSVDCQRRVGMGPLCNAGFYRWCCTKIPQWFSYQPFRLNPSWLLHHTIQILDDKMSNMQVWCSASMPSVVPAYDYIDCYWTSSQAWKILSATAAPIVLIYFDQLTRPLSDQLSNAINLQGHVSTRQSILLLPAIFQNPANSFSPSTADCSQSVVVATSMTHITSVWGRF